MNTFHHSSVSLCLLPDAEPLPEWVAVDALSPDELERFARTRHPQAREHFRRGRLLARSLLANVLHCSPNELTFTLSADGKPELRDAPTVHFNISHTAGLVAVALGEVPVGLDVETASDTRDIAGLVNRYFSHEERSQFAELPHELRPEAFLRGWTCKEALLKGIGSGVRDLQNCAVCLNPLAAPRVLRSPVAGWRLRAWRVGSVGVAVAAKGDPAHSNLELSQASFPHSAGLSAFASGLGHFG